PFFYIFHSMSQSVFRRKSLHHIQKEAATGMSDAHSTGLHKVLGVRDLTLMGIAAVVGAGIFSTIGKASYDGGPGIVFLFLFVSVACGFAAVCYAEFASMVPVSGSAYTYSYVAFGEIIAWIIGWDLLMEYAIGNIAVAISWSDYFTTLLDGLGIHLPAWITMDYWTAKDGLTDAAKEAWATAPSLGNFKLICDIPAFIVTIIITWIIYIGIKESKKTTNLMVIFKIAVIVLIIVMGFFYVDTNNWTPFLPNGFGGVLAGVSAVFYAYIGFDAISTTAEECKNPQRDLPRGMIYSLLICTALYILIALVLTGMVNYTELNVSDPLAFVFDRLGMQKTGYIISISAVVATTSVLLVFQLGQPRIWMSMSRDGLLPKRFGKVHPKFQTPSFATIVTGFLVGIPALFLPGSIVTDLTSIGTLFAFVLVCLGVLVLPKITHVKGGGRFKLPYINGKFIIPILVAGFIWLFKDRLLAAFTNMGNEGYQELLFIVFIAIAVIVAILSFLRNYSVIPIAGAMCCMYLMIEIPPISWLWFFVWMGLGLAIYFLYGYKKSKLAV
ncbi:MAG: amino acid permease, partial [Chitinophagaceae bacterium]|nr:amino acid permease [Chitinophagaceae bacterium]